ncbi:MAG: cardiolipin synthase [Clostridia bacterium]|nr:cardiolipin synthase [Clostridia bacterium]
MSKETLAAGRHETRTHSARNSSKDTRIVRVRTEKRGNAVKTLGFVFLIALQVAIILTLYFLYLAALHWYLVLSFVLSILSVFHVFLSKKEGQTKALWIFILVIGYSIGFIIYILSQEKIFYGRKEKRYREIYARAEKYSAEYAETGEHTDESRSDVQYLKSAGNLDAHNCSSVKFLASGSVLFDDVLDRLKLAQKFIFIEFFIVNDGILMKRMKNILYRKVKEGVDVRLIIDGIGSRSLSSQTRKELVENGVKLQIFNRFIPYFTFALNLRDHRKIVVIDGLYAYTGGCNLADEYINEKRMHGYWKDNGVLITGPAVDSVTLTFLRQYEFLSRQQEDYSRYLGLSFPSVSDSAVVPWADGKDYRRDIVKGLYTSIMTGAKKRLYIMTPYLVPDEETMSLLEDKALSGVDVRIVLPGVPDKQYVYYVTIARARQLMKSGVKCYLMSQSFVHSKVVLSENAVSVGSANIDLRSYYNQFENGVYTDDPSFMDEVLKDFESTFNLSTDLALKKDRFPLLNRFIAAFLRFFSPLM